MPKLRSLSGKDVCKILEAHGFLAVRRRGSHIVMQKRLPNTTVTVPVPNHKSLKRGTLMSIIRQSGISKTEFETGNE